MISENDSLLKFRSMRLTNRSRICPWSLLGLPSESGFVLNTRMFLSATLVVDARSTIRGDTCHQVFVKVVEVPEDGELLQVGHNDECVLTLSRSRTKNGALGTARMNSFSKFAKLCHCMLLMSYKRAKEDWLKSM